MNDLHSQEVLLQGPIENGLYVLPPSTASTTSPSSTALQAFFGAWTSTQLWHARLGHLSPRITALTLRRFHLPTTSSVALSSCSTWSQAKTHALPHPPSLSRSQSPFELLFLDIWGLAPVISTNGSHFYFSLVDDFPKYIWIFSMQSKSNVYSLILAFIRFASNTFFTNIVFVQPNWGGEFRPLHVIFQSCGISHRITYP